MFCLIGHSLNTLTALLDVRNVKTNLPELREILPNLNGDKLHSVCKLMAKIECLCFNVWFAGRPINPEEWNTHDTNMAMK